MSETVLRIELAMVEPLVWRRVRVPEGIDLHCLHQIIQTVMGWENAHLYEFNCNGVRYGEPDPFGMDPLDQGMALARETSLQLSIQQLPASEFLYIYDFGDDWLHRVVIEDSGLRDSAPCPRLLDGARACPPEDIGGPPGYQAYQQALGGQADEHGRMLLEGFGSNFDPTAFDAQRTNEALLAQHSGRGADHVVPPAWVTGADP